LIPSKCLPKTTNQKKLSRNMNYNDITGDKADFGDGPQPIRY